MSTYTDICNKVKETLVVDYHTRITPQQINFINPKNSYTGEIHAVGHNTIDGVTLKHAEISKSVVKDSILDNVKFKNGLNIDTVLQTVNNISAVVDDIADELDEKTTALHETDVKLSTALEFERINRKNADESLSADLMHEISFLAEKSELRDLALDNKINEEISSRISADSELKKDVCDRIIHDRHFELHLIDAARCPLELKDFAVNTIIDTVPDAYVYESNRPLMPIAKIENARYTEDGTVSAFTLNAYADTPETFELTGNGKLNYEFSKDQSVQYTGVGGYRLSYDVQARQGLNNMHLVLNSANKNGFYHANLGDILVGKVAWNGYDDPKIVDGKLVSCCLTILSKLLPTFSRIVPYSLKNGVTYDAGNDLTITLSDNVVILDLSRDAKYLPLLSMPTSGSDEPVEFGRIYEGNVFEKDGDLNAVVVEYNNKNYALYKDRNFSELVNKLDPYKTISYILSLNRVKVTNTRKYYEYKLSLEQGTFTPGYGISWNKSIDDEYSQAKVDLKISSTLLDKYVNKAYVLKAGSIANVLECKEEIYDEDSKLVGTIELMYFKLNHLLKLRISKLDLTDAICMNISINDDIAPYVIDLSSDEWYSSKICENILDIKESEWSIDYISGKKYLLDIDISKVDYRGESKIMHFDAKVEDAEGRKVTDRIDIKLPCKHSIPLNPFDVSRHFILNAKFYGKSLKDNDFITINIISNHYEDRFYYAGKPVKKIFLLKNKFSTLEFTEIRPHRFIINDLDISEVNWRIEWLHKRLSVDEISVANDINALSTNVDELSSEISTAIQRNRDDVSFFGDVHLKDKYNECDIHNHLSDLIATNKDTKGKVQYGFMYRCKAPAGRESEQFCIWNDNAQTSAFLKDNMYFVVNRRTDNDTIPLNELKYNDVAFFNNFDIDVANLSAYARQIELSASQISAEVNRLCTEISNDVVEKYEKLIADDSFISGEVDRLCVEISNDLTTKYSDLTTTVSSLCTTVSTDFVNRLSANDILGYNKFIGDVSAANVSVLNETICALTAGNVEFTNLTVHGELVAKDLKTDAIITHLSSVSVDIDIANILTANLSAANIKDATVTSLSIDSNNLKLVDRMSSLNEELSDLEAKTDFLLSVGHRSIEYFNDVRSIKYESHENADLVDWLKDNFNDVAELSGGLKQGFMFRLSAEQELYKPKDEAPYIVLGANDYFIVKHDIRPLDNAKFEDFAIIYDTQTEGKKLCTDLSVKIDSLELSTASISSEVNRLCSEISNDAVAKYNWLSGETDRLCSEISNDLTAKYNWLSGETGRLCSEISNDLTAKYNWLSGETDRLCSEISNDLTAKYNWLSGEVASNNNDIEYLSSELSDYHNTLSGIDRKSHAYENHISSDNLIVTDLNATPEGEHSRYYMTMDYGTIVMRKI